MQQIIQQKWSIAVGNSSETSKTVTVKTKDTYVDRDIEVSIKTAGLAVSGSSTNATATVTVQPAGVTIANKSASGTAAPASSTIDTIYLRYS